MAHLRCALVVLAVAVICLAAPARAGTLQATYWSSLNGGPVGLWLSYDDPSWWTSFGAGAYWDEWTFGSQYTWTFDAGLRWQGWGLGWRTLSHTWSPGLTTTLSGPVLRAPAITLGSVRVQGFWHGADFPGWGLRLSDAQDRIGFQAWWYTRPGGPWNALIWAGPFVAVNIELP